MELRTIRDAALAGKRVLTRVDFNVPLKNGHVADDTRIRAAVPTIAHMVRNGARVVLCSHLGRPKGQVNEDMRLAPTAPVLEKLLNEALKAGGFSPSKVRCAPDCIGDETMDVSHNADDHCIMLLENLRFHPGEEANDPEFARQLAEHGDLYVSDAFGTVHRAHASTEGVAHILPAYAGFLVEKEVTSLQKVIAKPERPIVIVLGGAKISGKIEVLENLIPLADCVLIGGAMANTFLRAQGKKTGKSLIEPDMLDTARRIMQDAEEQGTKLVLPLDYVVTNDIEKPAGVSTQAAGFIGDSDIAVDIGERTRDAFQAEIEKAHTVFWNGPMGVFEQEPFSQGTTAVAKAIADVFETAHTVVGGGESVAAVHKAGVADRIHHVSTGGGASLEFVAGRELPGVKVLMG